VVSVHCSARSCLYRNCVLMLLLAVQERKVAVDSLRSVAQLLTEAYQPLHDTVHGRSDVPENHSLAAYLSG